MKTVSRKTQGVQRGFTLVELLITMAIVAILAAIALPAYNDYVTRAQVIEAVELGGGLKAPVAAYGQEQNAWPTGIVAAGQSPTATQISGTISGKYSSVSTTIGDTFPKGKITITVNEGQAKDGTVLYTTEDGGAKWTCSSESIAAKWLPNACKNMGGNN